MKTLVLFFLFVSPVFFSCEDKEKTVSKTDLFYLDVPSKYKANTKDPATVLKDTYEITYKGITYNVVVEAVVTDNAIVSMGCSINWAHDIGLTRDGILAERYLMAELDDIMASAPGDALRAPKWWVKFKKWLKKVFVGCTGIKHSVNPVTGRCQVYSVSSHWLWGAGQPILQGGSCENNPESSDCD